MVDALASNLEALRRQVNRTPTSNQFVWKQALLASSAQNEVAWYSYNDNRLNGVVSLERWLSFYQNLQLIKQEMLPAQTLAAILHDWQATINEQSRINLTIAQGNPLEVLQGAGRWIHRIQRILLQGPRAAELWKDSCNSWLQQQGFQPDTHKPLCWNLVPLSSRMVRLPEDTEEQHMMLELKMNALIDRRDKLNAALSLVFPYAAYRRERTDLSDYSDTEILEHFVAYGIHDKVNIQPSIMESKLEQLQAERSAQDALLELLKEQARQTAQQLDLLKEQITKLIMNQ